MSSLFFIALSLSLVYSRTFVWQIGTTKGTGGDILVLEEAAYCDEGFFYETVAPILSIGSSSLVAISTLTSEINFYTRLIKMVDPATERPLFTVRSIELACEKCKLAGKAQSCVHLLHLVPRWHSGLCFSVFLPVYKSTRLFDSFWSGTDTFVICAEERHRKLKIMMQDRPDLLLSEMQGCSFDALEQVFPKASIALMMDLKALPSDFNTKVFVVVDPAAGGPSSDYAIVSIVRTRGTVTVSFVCFLFLCQCVCFLAHVDKCTERNLVVEEGRGDSLVEVEEESRVFALVCFGVDVHDVFLQIDVDV